MQELIIRFFISLSLLWLLNKLGQAEIIDSSEIVLSQPFPVALPPSCHLPNSSLSKQASYNRGYCPHTPCHALFGVCSKSHKCCLNDWESEMIPLVCLGNSLRKNVTIIKSCRCQECDKAHKVVSGYVYSSLDQKPLTLAAVILKNEVMTFTNHNGYFVLDVSYASAASTLLLQEPNHQSLEVSILPTEADNVLVTLERISSVTEVMDFNNSVSLKLDPINLDQRDIFIGSLYLPGGALFVKPLKTIYTGPGRILHSISSGTLHFTTPALHKPVYTDTKNAKFIIFSFVSGTFDALDESGVSLSLSSSMNGQFGLLVDSIQLNHIGEKQLEKLHLFHFELDKNCWIDLGKMQTTKKNTSSGQRTVVSIQLKHLPLIWTVAIPVRVSCFIHVSVNGKQYENSLSVQINLKQVYSDGSIGKMSYTYHQQLTATPGNVDHCLAAVCNLGGTITVTGQHGHHYIPSIPNIQHGMLFGSNAQLMFYCNDNAEINSNSTSPYYPTLQLCMSSIGITDHSTSGRFVFDAPPAVSAGLHSSFPKPLRPIPKSLHRNILYSRHCYVKVSVLACALETVISAHANPSQAQGNRNTKRGILVSETVHLPSGQDECLTDSVLHPLSACLQYPCGHDLVLLADYRLHNNQTTSCIPWTFSPLLVYSTDSAPYSITIQDHPDLYNTDSGLYSAATDALALMRCMSGQTNRPSLTLDNTRGVAVTFTCRAL